MFLSDVGEKPGKMYTMDRIDNNGNYEPTNVRWVTQSEQLINQRIRCDNKSGHKGIHWFERTSSWMVYINRDKKRIHIGYFKELHAAISARKSAEESLCQELITKTQAARM